MASLESRTESHTASPPAAISRTGPFVCSTGIAASSASRRNSRSEISEGLRSPNHTYGTGSPLRVQAGSSATAPLSMAGVTTPLPT